MCLFFVDRCIRGSSFVRNAQEHCRIIAGILQCICPAGRKKCLTKQRIYGILCKVICFTVNVVMRIFEKDMTVPLLMDLYGQVLSERKRELMDYYYNEDYSLAEIAEITGISRQGIRESVKKSEAELRELDASLHLVERTQRLDERIAAVEEQLHDLLAEPLTDPIREKIEQIRNVLDTLSF